jgi:hypothetical protein
MQSQVWSPMELPERCIMIAREYLGVREVPPRSNRGPQVDRFIRVGGGLDPEGNHYAWCAAFVSDVVVEAYTRRDVELDQVGPPQFQGGPSALGLLAKNKALRIKKPTSRCIGVMDFGRGKGHVFFIVSVLPGGRLRTVEGNTGPGPAAPAADREGDGVYERTDRRISDCAGFLRIG